MKRRKFYIKYASDFIDKIKNIGNIPARAIFVNANEIGLYPHEAGLNALRGSLDSIENKHTPTENLLKMGEFVSENNYFEFNGKFKKQFSGTAIGTKFAPTYASIFVNKISGAHPIPLTPFH